MAVFKLAHGDERVMAPVWKAEKPVEKRRSTGQAKNVARLPGKAQSKAAPKALAGAKNGTDGEWEEF